MTADEALNLVRARKAEYDRALLFEDLFCGAGALTIPLEQDRSLHRATHRPRPKVASCARLARQTILHEKKVMARRLATYSELSINEIASRVGLHRSTLVRDWRLLRLERPPGAPTYLPRGPTFHHLE